jgi:hypothetical protein
MMGMTPSLKAMLAILPSAIGHQRGVGGTGGLSHGVVLGVGVAFFFPLCKSRWFPPLGMHYFVWFYRRTPNPLAVNPSGLTLTWIWTLTFLKV